MWTEGNRGINLEIDNKYWIQKVGQVFCVLKVIQEHNQEMPLDSKNIIEI